ncbi:methionine adenosyltransferase [[Clostridium] scindens]|uniref:methionine adenosyltransferase n=1 Tax=Clostridium scindens (strain JCM 10418 / VPI 12708) TaxID=29347 RepID=UPI001D08FE1E|nr:methionine adenosyltransferase [[Clostridium] scindens]MCB6286283.1 methionine adenosyltransferase [[Clostridium] scindens]MCB6421039.1 methionine adenosyltransferase [[Clostridium] scindens]MCB7192798.1 methionine adenosyltransferase [[Clostridium] scindens]MCB7285982.1 methionine adenosyltransferase [[Clostridium] scindens]MCG4929890.1 methionine adenosyltransferase [[Clostridium] scindens]
MKRYYTAEAVTEGHPDKLCDLIADSILDECLREDRESKVACEVLATKGHILVAGEITSRHEPYVFEIVKKVLEEVGYPSEEVEMDAQIHQQSPDIAKAVTCSKEKREGRSADQSDSGAGAGDQGIMIGYACMETSQMMPLPAVLANRIVRELSACRVSGYIRGILPDGKAQVTVEYEDGTPVRIDSVVVSCQHVEDKTLKKLEHEIREKVLRPALRPLPPDEDTKILINPSGRFVCGGMDADTGLTGRKLMADTYGSMVPHGGGAFSGKDCSKVDRSGAYMARYIAKNIVAAGLAEKCQVSLAYAIGVAEPVMVQVDTFGTGTACADDCLAAAVPLVFGLTPAQIRESLRLDRPIYKHTAVFGHFGRKEFPWERTDKAGALRDAIL